MLSLSKKQWLTRTPAHLLWGILWPEALHSSALMHQSLSTAPPIVQHTLSTLLQYSPLTVLCSLSITPAQCMVEGCGRSWEKVIFSRRLSVEKGSLYACKTYMQSKPWGARPRDRSVNTVLLLCPQQYNLTPLSYFSDPACKLFFHHSSAWFTYPTKTSDNRLL